MKGLPERCLDEADVVPFSTDGAFPDVSEMQLLPWSCGCKCVSSLVRSLKRQHRI